MNKEKTALIGLSVSTATLFVFVLLLVTQNRSLEKDVSNIRTLLDEEKSTSHPDLKPHSIAPETNIQKAPEPLMPKVGSNLIQRFVAVLDDPKALGAFDQIAKGQVRRKHEPTLISMGLDKSQRESVLALLVRQSNSETDVAIAAISQGLDPFKDTQTMAGLIAQSKIETDGQLRELLGDVKYRQFTAFQNEEPIRNLTENIQKNAYLDGVPLSDAQVAALHDVFRERVSTNPGTNAILSDEVLGKASKFLNPQQLSSVSAVKSETDASLYLNALMSK
jgi:hypothetical protein